MLVWAAKNIRAKNAARIAQMAKPTPARNTPFVAMWLARSRSPAPSARPISAFTPTAVPVARPIIRFCAGNASETAVSACSQMRETKTLSTMLYSACTSIETMMGRDMFQMSFEMGMVPSLFPSMRLTLPFHQIYST